MSQDALVCHCSTNINVERCLNCKKPVCPNHRVGLGSLSDGYTCLACPAFGFGFPGAAPIAKPMAEQRLSRLLQAIPVLVWVLVVILCGAFGFLLSELWRAQP